MKKNFRILLFIGMLFVVTGCGNHAFNENDVKDFVMDYKTNQYTIDNASNPPSAVEIGEKVKPYLSEEQHEEFLINRYFHFMTVVAENTGYESKLKDVNLKKTEKNDDGTVDYDYIITVEYYNNSSSELVETKGQLTIQYDGEQYKITRDWENTSNFVQEAILKRN